MNKKGHEDRERAFYSSRRRREQKNSFKYKFVFN